MQIIPIKSRIIEEGDDLLAVFQESLEQARGELKDGDVVVVSSKVVAICEGRVVNLAEVEPSERAIELAKETYDRTEIEDPRFTELVLREAEHVLPGALHLTINERVLIPAAGIDRSNIPEGKVVLWPLEPQRSADLWREALKGDSYKNLGVIVADSHCQPMRKGVIGIALSWSGFEGIEDVRGEPDIYGKKLQVTQKAVADNLTCAATAVMGEGNDCVPFVIIREAPVKFTDELQDNRDNFFPPQTCIFSGIYSDEFKKVVGEESIEGDIS